MLSGPLNASRPSGLVLMRLTVPIPLHEAHLWVFGRALEPMWGPSVAQWSDPCGSLAFVALGTAFSLALPAEGRFAAARQALAGLHEDSITLGEAPPVVGPMALCALAFEDQACGRPGPFGTLGGGQLLAPSCVVYTELAPLQPRGTRSVLVTLQLLCPRGDDAARRKGATTLENWARAVHDAARAWPGQMPSAPGDNDNPAPILPVSAGALCQRDFEGAVSRAQSALGESLHKVVLARMEALAISVDVTATAEAFRAEATGGVAFALSLPGGAHFLGATPETLVRLHGGRVATEALAGTMARGADPQTDAAAARALVGSHKDQQEHAAVVAGIGQALSALVHLEPMPAGPEPKGLRHMWHLHTPIRGRSRQGVGILALAEALHPTPALGGLPMAAAQRYLFEHEHFRRGLYAAPLGWVSSSGDGVFVAGIRSLWCADDRAVLFAGAGIVAASQPQSEWQETVLKLTPARRCLRRVQAAYNAEDPS